ncbi:hypothetical protein [Demequina sp. NBRC 110055]|uniref:hypothetical protein n=1 Tax=Demequina sp. NBRC 110055 TaxID=1570344 RepID=UPI0009FF8E1C|nr:hypothetical protein [Demequina sp. NBRC 110055]
MQQESGVSHQVAEALRDAWPDVPEGLKPVLANSWATLGTKGTPGAPYGDAANEDEFLTKVAVMAASAEFGEAEARQFFESALEAAGVPETERGGLMVALATKFVFVRD